jgi:DNA-binding winged helix-turn-helix (wHTH) protein
LSSARYYRRRFGGVLNGAVKNSQFGGTFWFGPYTFDAARRRLSRDGQSIEVPPKALDVLEVLLENRGRTVEKCDLMGRVWPDTAVEDANLTQSVFLLRRALGDAPSASRYISTVARRGYRFVGAATETSAEVPDQRRAEHCTANLKAYHAYLKGAALLVEARCGRGPRGDFILSASH